MSQIAGRTGLIISSYVLQSRANVLAVRSKSIRTVFDMLILAA